MHMLQLHRSHSVERKLLATVLQASHTSSFSPSRIPCSDHGWEGKELSTGVFGFSLVWFARSYGAE
jgi:hypothetical protein